MRGRIALRALSRSAAPSSARRAAPVVDRPDSPLPRAHMPSLPLPPHLRQGRDRVARRARRERGDAGRGRGRVHRVLGRLLGRARPAGQALQEDGRRRRGRGGGRGRDKGRRRDMGVNRNGRRRMRLQPRAAAGRHSLLASQRGQRGGPATSRTLVADVREGGSAWGEGGRRTAFARRRDGRRVFRRQGIGQRGKAGGHRLVGRRERMRVRGCVPRNERMRGGEAGGE